MANNCNKTFRDLINDGQAQVLGIVSIVPMGDWNGTTTYQKLNYVRHNGATYLAKVANNNVEPRVAANWEDVWMLCNYDGGLVVPDGTYPDLTAGQVLYPLSFGSKTYNGSSAQTVTAADLGVASAYIPQGSITFANLPSTPSAATLSYVWDISDQFTTDSRFIEGAGQTYSAGTNVGVIEQNGNYYYDVFGSFVDLSNYAQINGTYSGMTVGKATQADNATAATDAAKLGGVVAENYSQINGTYSGMTVGAATKATQDGDGNIIPDTYAKQSGTYPNMTVGNATKATQDGNGNNIVHTYPKIQTFLWDYDSYGQYLQTGVSGSIFIYNCGGNTGIVVINIKISPALQPYTSKLIMLFDLLPDAVKCATGDGIQSVVTYRTNDAWMQTAILEVSSEGIYIRAQAHATQADEYIRGFCVYPTRKSIE